MIVADVNLDTELLFAALAIVTGVGLVLYGLVAVIERLVARKYGSGDAQQLLTI
jgi:ABC-type nitrate/sulfonate/bicarbonate transport system permease component